MAPDFAGSVGSLAAGVREAARATAQTSIRPAPRNRDDSAPVRESFSEALRQSRQRSEGPKAEVRASKIDVAVKPSEGEPQAEGEPQVAASKEAARESGSEKAQERPGSAQERVIDSARVESAALPAPENADNEPPNLNPLNIAPALGIGVSPPESPASVEVLNPDDSQFEQVDGGEEVVAPVAPTDSDRAEIDTNGASVNSGEGRSSGGGTGVVTEAEARTTAGTEVRGRGGESASDAQWLKRESPILVEQTSGRVEGSSTIAVKGLPAGERAPIQAPNPSVSPNVKQATAPQAAGNQESVEVRERSDRSVGPESRQARNSAERSIFSVVEEAPAARAQAPVQLAPGTQGSSERPATSEQQGPTANGRHSAYSAVVANQATSGGESEGERSSEGYTHDRPRGSQTGAAMDVRGADDTSSGSRPSGQTVVIDPNLKLATPLGVAAGPQTGKPEAQSAPAEAQIVAQSVARGLAAAVNQRGGSVTLRLVPESLGLVRIHMSLAQGAVSVRLEATTPAAQGLLSEHIAMLRSSLESRGLTIEKLSVQYTPASSAVMAAMPQGSGHSSNGGLQQQLAQQAADEQAAWQDAAGDQSRGRRDTDSEESGGNNSKRTAGGQALASGSEDAASRLFGGRLRLRMETVA